MKKTMFAVFMVMMIPTGAMAHGHLWYDLTSHVPQFKKLVIYPLSYSGKDNYLLTDDEQNNIYKMNDYLDKKMMRKLKYKTIPLGHSIQENKEIRIDEEKYHSLYGPFADEKARGAAVGEITAADGYLVPRIRENRLETYQSPQKVVNITMRAWTEITNGPNGNQITDNWQLYENHIIPAKTQYLRHMDMEYTLYNDQGDRVLTFENNNHLHDSDEVHSFRELTDEFRKDMRDMVQKKTDKKIIGDKVYIGLMDIPDSVAEYAYNVAFIQYATLERAKKVKNLSVAISKNDRSTARYLVYVNLDRFSLDRQWVAPYAYTTNDVVSSYKQKWWDNKGNEHEMRVTSYITKVHDVYGHWAYSATVKGGLFMIDTKNNKVVAKYEGEETDDKTSDAYLHLVDAFYSVVKKNLK